MKITTKTTKEQLKSFLGANALKVKKQDKNLYDQIAYADKMAKKDDSKVTRKDLADLVKSVITLLGDKCVEPALAQETPLTPQAENSVKKLAKGVSKKQKSMEETPVEETPAPKESKSEKTAKKTQETDKEEKVDNKSAKKSLGAKKTPTKKDGDTDSKKGTVQKEEEEYQFPATLKVGDTNYELAHDIKTMEDLYKALEKDEEIVFAFYYDKKMLKQAPYFFDVLGHPKSFDNDLDLATTIYVSEEFKVAYHISMYTEGCYNTIPDDFEEVDGIRYAGTMIYQIYRAV